MFFSVYRLGEDGDLKNEGGGMLLVWALRARSYKTKAEVRQPGHRPPSSPRGLFGFCLMAQVPPGHKSVPSVLSVKSVVKDKSYPWWNRLEFLWILDGT